jgi:hypothetical protein
MGDLLSYYGDDMFRLVRTLNRVAGRVLDQHLLAALPRHDLIAKAAPRTLQPLHRTCQRIDLNLNPVPTTGSRCLSIRHPLSGAACTGLVEQQS